MEWQTLVHHRGLREWDSEMRFFLTQERWDEKYRSALRRVGNYPLVREGHLFGFDEGSGKEFEFLPGYDHRYEFIMGEVFPLFGVEDPLLNYDTAEDLPPREETWTDSLWSFLGY